MLEQAPGRQNDPAFGILAPPSGTDALSCVLETVRLRGAVFFQWQPSWPYATGVPDCCLFRDMVAPGADQVLSYHIVVEGPCWASVKDETPVRLESGDILLLPRGDAYVISSEPQAPGSEDEESALAFFAMMARGELPAVIVDGGGGENSNRLICGFIGCDTKPCNPLIHALPRMIRISAPARVTDPLSALIQLAVDESSRPHPGSHCLLMRLSEVMFIEVVRRYLRTQSTSLQGWPGALSDPLIGACLNLLHRKLDQHWTIDTLARELGTSRTVLAQRFTETIGEPPMHYLSRWRMQVAASRLADANSKTFAIAQEVGYQSEAAFNRAFKRIVGVTPGQWRQQKSP